MDEDLYPKYPHLENLDRVPEVLSAPYLHITDIKREGRDDFAKLNENEQKALGKVSNAATKRLMDELRSEELAARTSLRAA